MHPLRDLWRSVKEQIELILLTALVTQVSKMAKEKVREYAHRINETTDKKWGDKAQVVQRAVAENLELIVTEFQT